MSLKKMLKEVPLWRPFGYPVWSRRVVAVCFHKDLSQAAAMLGDWFYASCCDFFVVDHNHKTPREIAGNLGSGARSLPVRSLFKDKFPLDADIVMFFPQYEWSKLSAGVCALKTLGFNAFYVYMPMPHDDSTATCLPRYYEEYKEELESVFELFDDRESQEVFASRVRALTTGNIGYFRVSNYNEYYHPKVRPQKGDVIIDGGISRCINSQLAFCASIGEDGCLYGFEPDPMGFVDAYNQIQDREDCRHFRLIPLGLWSEKTSVSFASSGSGSRVKDDQTGNVTCEMTTVDDFVRENALDKVDFLKLDVEGAEQQVLRAAVKTLARHKPRLAISLYHLPDDLFAIPLFIKNILPDSHFYLGHHTACVFETVLYVLPR